MTNIYEQNCPLCQSPAKYQFRNFEEFKYFRCNVCKDFVITPRAENELCDTPEGRRRKQYLSSEAAKLNDSDLLFIFVSPEPKTKGMASDFLSSDIQPISDWL